MCTHSSSLISYAEIHAHSMTTPMPPVPFQGCLWPPSSAISESHGTASSALFLSYDLFLKHFTPSHSGIFMQKSSNHRMVWLGRDLKEHLIPTPCLGQGHLPHSAWPLNTCSGFNLIFQFLFISFKADPNERNHLDGNVPPYLRLL